MRLDGLDLEVNVEINNAEKKIRVTINNHTYEFVEDTPAKTIALAILTILKDVKNWRSPT